MYDVGKIMYIGGGNDPGSNLPSRKVEVIDCTLPFDQRTWLPAASLHHRRRHHNATILPDGTVLVTGGTSGKDFNDLSPGRPVHIAEYGFRIKIIGQSFRLKLWIDVIIPPLSRCQMVPC
jgi:galactose oxidase